ncbi:transcriptional repressor [Bifidobacterium sp. SMB2]|uniref:Transcriptional repressor n=1 Tax=Bifidobacterium saimiriisciurei TaxID=2661627 RepID=A0ABX0C8S7_9BIFI|nr:MULTISPECIES: transcriptional repressor [Bifidobacterium]NEG96489.1 transcriptional repressor [Bifidobacterium sp. SMB2]NEH10594.1 transcriptional repressor [Bifidobacterium saimiriisciurei]NEH10623.1 transcriptional repressor [Bifidobacterium saimiriisciurei]
MVEHLTRRTVQKETVRAALRQTDDFISAQNLHRRLQDAGSKIGLATVYRQLNAMAAAGEADTIRMGGEQLFRDCGEDAQRHHHHLVCERCGKTIDIEPPSEAWFRKVAEDNGFAISHHILEIFGVCAECADAERRSADDGVEAADESSTGKVNATD